MSKKQKWEAKQKHMKYKQGVAHRFENTLVCWGKKYCSGCGLLALNNEATRKAMSKPCNSMEE